MLLTHDPLLKRCPASCKPCSWLSPHACLQFAENEDKNPRSMFLTTVSVLVAGNSLFVFTLVWYPSLLKNCIPTLLRSVFYVDFLLSPNPEFFLQLIFLAEPTAAVNGLATLGCTAPGHIMTYLQHDFHTHSLPACTSHIIINITNFHQWHYQI